jgi:hypothetical protein
MDLNIIALSLVCIPCLKLKKKITQLKPRHDNTIIYLEQKTRVIDEARTAIRIIIKSMKAQAWIKLFKTVSMHTDPKNETKIDHMKIANL